jgi:antirestriction protein ArdC
MKPWWQPPGLNIPANAVTGRLYSGVNTFLLWVAQHNGWPQPRFLTFKQAQEAGGHVRAGEHGRRVVFVKDIIRRADEGEDEASRFRMLPSYTVFNIAQCDGLPDRITTPPKPLNPNQRDALIDEFIAATGIQLQETIDNEAFYRGGARTSSPCRRSGCSAAGRTIAPLCSTSSSTPPGIPRGSIAAWEIGSGCSRTRLKSSLQK